MSRKTINQRERRGSLFFEPRFYVGAIVKVCSFPWKNPSCANRFSLLPGELGIITDLIKIKGGFARVRGSMRFGNYKCRDFFPLENLEPISEAEVADALRFEEAKTLGGLKRGDLVRILDGARGLSGDRLSLRPGMVGCVARVSNGGKWAMVQGLQDFETGGFGDVYREDCLQKIDNV